MTVTVQQSEKIQGLFGALLVSGAEFGMPENPANKSQENAKAIARFSLLALSVIGSKMARTDEGASVTTGMTYASIPLVMKAGRDLLVGP
nr:hypothetical protein [uncultured Nitrososphaera sp.]